MDTPTLLSLPIPTSFHIKQHSKALDCNLTVAIAAQYADRVVFAGVLFHEDGVTHLDSFESNIERGFAIEAIENGTLISVLEDKYLQLQADYLKRVQVVGFINEH